MNMHALCSAFRGVREQGMYSHIGIHRYVEGKATRGRGWEREGERKIKLETVQRTERGRMEEEGKRRGERGEEGEWLRLLICIRKTKGVGRAVCPSFRVTKDQGSQSKVFSLDFFLVVRARSKVCTRASNYHDVSANFSRRDGITGVRHSLMYAAR